MRKTYDLQGIRFEWDRQKASKNLRKHGIIFEEACEVLLDPLMDELDSQYRDGELREKVVGMTVDWKLLCVVYTYYQEDEVYRIISARNATKRERIGYENF